MNEKMHQDILEALDKPIAILALANMINSMLDQGEAPLEWENIHHERED